MSSVARTFFSVFVIVAALAQGGCKSKPASSDASSSAPSAVNNANAIKVLPAIFDEAALAANPKVQSECDIQAKLPHFVEAFANGAAVAVTSADAQGKVLKIVISNMWGTGGGMFSGMKRLEVRGELMENGQKIAGFVAQRSTTGGAYGGYKGTCSLLGRCAKTLGKDIAGWLANPTDNARLGER